MKFQEEKEEEKRSSYSVMEIEKKPGLGTRKSDLES